MAKTLKDFIDFLQQNKNLFPSAIQDQVTFVVDNQETHSLLSFSNEGQFSAQLSLARCGGNYVYGYPAGNYYYKWHDNCPDPNGACVEVYYLNRFLGSANMSCNQVPSHVRPHISCCG